MLPDRSEHPFLEVSGPPPRRDRETKGIAPADAHETARGAADIVPAALHVCFPWEDVHAIAGPLLPGSLTIVSARTGSGKTLFIRNWLHALATDHTRPPRPIAYFPTETPAREVLRGIACAELGVNPVDISRDDFSRVVGGSAAFFATAQAVANRLQTPLSDLTGPPLAIYDHPRPTVALIRRTLEEAAARGCAVAVIDHILRLHLGDGTQPFAEVTNAVRALKILAEELQLAVVITSQQNRASAGGDKLAWFAPPDLSALKGAGTLEEEADLVLFLHRLLRDDLTDKDRAAVRSGALPLQEVIAPHLMGCAIGKSRLDGGKTGAACRLWVDHGRVTDLPAAERSAWQARIHAIRTNRDL